MNEIVNTFLFAGDRFMPEMHLRRPRFTYSACGAFTKTEKEYTNLKKQKIDDIFIKTNKIKTWLMEILKIKLKEYFLIKYCVIKHLILLKIQNMMVVEGVLLQWFINFFDKKTSGGAVKNENVSNK